MCMNALVGCCLIIALAPTAVLNINTVWPSISDKLHQILMCFTGNEV